MLSICILSVRRLGCFDPCSSAQIALIFFTPPPRHPRCVCVSRMFVCLRQWTRGSRPCPETSSTSRTSSTSARSKGEPPDERSVGQTVCLLGKQSSRRTVSLRSIRRERSAFWNADRSDDLSIQDERSGSWINDRLGVEWLMRREVGRANGRSATQRAD